MDVFIHPQFDAIYRRHPLVLVDVGARGGLKTNWSAARRHLRVLGFEPDKQEFQRLVERQGGDGSTEFFEVALSNRHGPLRLHVARDRGLSSVFEPNRSFLDAFPDSARFDTLAIDEVLADSLDNQLQLRGIVDLDFIKVDTQGSEHLVLEGAAGALASSVFGVEIEVEFAPIYRDQPLFADVDVFMRNLGFHLFDLRPCYWKRAAARDIGGPRGQIIWADALYLKSTSALQQALTGLDAEMRRSKLLRAVSVSLLYGYFDYAFEVVRSSGAVLDSQEQAVIEARLREAGAPSSPFSRFPGRRKLAAAFHRLWKLCVQRDESWSISNANLGNRS
jgi:FkbM family methyltransferase